MTKTLAVFNAKGGCAKTTSTMFIAQGLVQRGYSVRVLDLDPQNSAYQWAQKADMPFEVTPVATVSQLSMVRATEDVVVVDCSPAHAKLFDAMLEKADAFIVPMKATVLDAQQAVRIFGILASHDKKVLPLLSMIRWHSVAARQAQKMLERQMNSLFDEPSPVMRVRQLDYFANAGFRSIDKLLDYTDVVAQIEKEVL